MTKRKYKLFAEETRKEVWALELPEFANTAVPEKYKDESAVILAAHSRLEVTSIDVQLRTSEHRSMYSYVRLSIDRCTAT